MDDSKILPLDNVTAVDDVREWQEGDHKPFVLRGNVECEQLLATLDSLGVTYFDCIYWRDQESPRSYCTGASFKKKGGRFSVKRLQSVSMAQGELTGLLRDAVDESLVGTYVENADLMVCFKVSVCQKRRGITARIKVIGAFSRYNDDCDVVLL